MKNLFQKNAKVAIVKVGKSLSVIVTSLGVVSVIIMLVVAFYQICLHTHGGQLMMQESDREFLLIATAGAFAVSYLGMLGWIKSDISLAQLVASVGV